MTLRIKTLARPLGLILSLVILSSCNPEAEEEGSESAPLPSTPVEVAAVKAKTLALHPMIKLMGRLEALPERSARLSSRLRGSLQTLDAVEGRDVPEGATLARLDPTLFDSAVAQATATLQERHAILKRLKRGPRPQEIAAGKAALQRASALVQSTTAILESLNALASARELSPIRLAQAQAAQRMAIADEAAARAALALLQAGTRPERIDEAQASLDAAKQDLEIAKARKSFTLVKAPFAGTVTRVLARVGLGLTQGAPLLELSDLSVLLLRVRVPASLLSQVSRGDTCDIAFDALPGKTRQGVVDRFAASGDQTTGGVFVFIAVKNQSGLLRPMMTGRASLQLATLAPSVVVPIGSAAERSGISVITVIREGAAFEVEVEIGARAGGWVQVLDGVKEGEWVATRGGYGLPAGQSVTIAAMKNPEASLPR